MKGTEERFHQQNLRTAKYLYAARLMGMALRIEKACCASTEESEMITRVTSRNQVVSVLAHFSMFLALSLLSSACIAQMTTTPAAPKDARALDDHPAATPPDPADVFVVFIGTKNAERAGYTFVRSVDGRLKKIGRPGYADVDAVNAGLLYSDIDDAKTARLGREKAYESRDPALLNELIRKLQSVIKGVGIDVSDMYGIKKNIPLSNLRNGDLVPEGGFAVFLRKDLPVFEPWINSGDIAMLGEVSVISTLNAIRGEQQRIAAAERRVEEGIDSFLARVPAFANSMLALLVDVRKGDDGKSKLRFCTVEADGEAGALKAGLRYFEALNKSLKTQQDSRFDEVSTDLEGLYDLTQNGKCQVLVLNNVEAASLARSMQRDGIRFSAHLIVQKPDLLDSYARLQGYRSNEKYLQAQRMVPNAVVTPKGLERLEAVGITSVAGFNAAADRMIGSRYASDRSVDNVLAFLSDEKTGKESRLTALQVRDARERKALAEREAQDAAEKTRRIEFAKQYPYYAVISCGTPGHLNIMPCFRSRYGAQTELKVTNGGESQLYKIYNLRQAGREGPDGLHVDLKSNFMITAQNASEMMILSVSIFDRRDGKKLFGDQAAQFGVVTVRR